MRSDSLTLSARWIFPVEGEPIQEGCLTIENGRIRQFGPSEGRAIDLELGNVAVVPGFVNAHTHLELTSIEPEPVQISNNGHEDEIGWLRRVIEQRKGRTVEELQGVVSKNLDHSRSSGTTMLADITTAGLSWDAVAASPVRAVVFAEMIGLRRERALETSQAAFAWMASIKPEEMVSGCARPGLSPHAPYSTAGWVYERAAAAQGPLCTHLAEMPEELELLAHGTGRLREYLQDLGAWDEAWEPLGPSPADYLRRGDQRNRDWLVAHGNYLTSDDFWQFLPDASSQGQRVAVALCPRTAARFGHLDTHPFREMLHRGVIVCLGTDSLASSPTLSILDELRALHRFDRSLGGRLLLTMATLFGAWALRAETVTGSLKPGKSADLAIIALPDQEAADPHDLLLESDLPVLGTMFEGEFVHGPWTGG